MVRHKRHIPNRGDLLWLSFSPHKGREQGGRRPALVLSHISYNERTGLALVCPLTSKQKGYAGEVVCMVNDQQSFILADQIQCVDWCARKSDFLGRINQEICALVQDRIIAMIQGVI